MDLNTIRQDLKRKYSEPLPEFYKRRIVFWYDEDREFEDQIDELQLEGVKIGSDDRTLSMYRGFQFLESRFLLRCLVDRQEHKVVLGHLKGRVLPKSCPH